MRPVNNDGNNADDDYFHTNNCNINDHTMLMTMMKIMIAATIIRITMMKMMMVIVNILMRV